MLRHARWLIVLGLAGMAAAGCASQAVVEATDEPPAVVESIDGSDFKQVTLTEATATRLGITTAAVTSGDAGQVIVPAAAVLYDANGATFVYTNPSGLAFVRAEITVATIKGAQAWLASGPPPDTRVVVQGVAELFGTESGVGDPE